MENRMLWFWIELTTPAGQKVWVNLATCRAMRRTERNDATHLISLSSNAEGQPDVTTVTETPEEILKLASTSQKADTPTGIGFIHPAYSNPSK
jgi:hypothetical protein